MSDSDETILQLEGEGGTVVPLNQGDRFAGFDRVDEGNDDAGESWKSRFVDGLFRPNGGGRKKNSFKEWQRRKGTDDRKGWMALVAAIAVFVLTIFCLA